MATLEEHRRRIERYWQDRIANYLVRGRLTRALDYLARVIDAPPTLFEDDAIFTEERRVAWMLRVNILIQHHRFREALAWVMYELEVNPDTPVALALRTKLRRLLKLDSAPPNSTTTDKEQRHDWPNVAGMRGVKAMLERDVLLPLVEPELFERYGLAVPNGILFYGPPGCGKTHIARAVARMAGRTFLDIKPSDLGSIYIHGTQRKIGALFDQAREKAPCLMFLDEFDALVPERGQAGGHYDREVNEFLVQLDNCSKDGILVIGATNRLNNIDTAIKRPGRMDKKVFIGLPDIEARSELIRLTLEGRPATSIDNIGFAKRTEKFTAAEIVQVCDDAARMALDQRQDISEIDLQRAIRDFKPQGFSNDPTDWE